MEQGKTGRRRFVRVKQTVGGDDTNDDGPETIYENEANGEVLLQTTVSSVRQFVTVR